MAHSMDKWSNGFRKAFETAVLLRRLNDFVHHYEPLSYEPIDMHRGRRWKRSVPGSSARRGSDIEFTFRAYNKEFKLRLQPDRSAFSKDFILQTHRGPIKNHLDHLYSGHVVGFPGSHVVGAVIGGVFSGRISLSRDGEQFYVERAGRYSLESFHSLIYSAHDVSSTGSHCGLNGATKDVLDKVRRRYGRQLPRSSKHRRAERLAPGNIDTTAMSSALKSPQNTPRASIGNDGIKVAAFESSTMGLVPPYLPLRRKTHVKRVCNMEIIVDHRLFQAVSSEEGARQRRL
ncbi:disintegrin and metalloproteinase domain-containing protein 10-like [Haemaphysalis longicornis]